jgi:uncharacterized protein (UPF0276 family)
MIYVSTACVKKANVIDAITALAKFTRHIELSGGSLYQENLLTDLITLKQQQSLDFILHSYFPPPRTPMLLNFADNSEQTREFITQSMHFIEKLGIDYYSIHAGFKKDFQLTNELLEGGSKNFSFSGMSENITWFNQTFTQKLALENLFPNNDSETCFMSSFDDILGTLTRYPSIYLLLDLGHLKLSSRYYGFNYLDAVDQLFSNYADRILELHLSDNHGSFDDHHIIHSDSIQYMLVKTYKNIIAQHKIKITIEARGYSLAELEKSYKLIRN